MNHIQMDKDQLERMGITYSALEEQISMITQGTERIKLHAAAVIGDGIIRLEAGDYAHYARYFSMPERKLEVVKFVPASGAATRMFKDLLKFYNSGEHNPISTTFFNQLSRFPFYTRLKTRIPDQIDGLDQQKAVLKTLFYDPEFSYLSIPKGLIPFHKIGDEVRTAFESHFIEACGYQGENRNVCLHFTVSLEHRDRINETLNRVKIKMNNPEISLKYSLQSISTDTVALSQYDEIVRDADGQMVFRPGGHGSLINNLNDIHADLIFIRNIDNIVPPKPSQQSARYDSVMAGYLLKLKQERDRLLTLLDDEPNDAVLEEAMKFISNELKHTAPQNHAGDKVEFIRHCLDRPMRICGMVKNEGEPGGGPYKVMKNDHLNLQIVESSQMDMEDEEQVKIIRSATHFNPVDIICSTRNHHGEKYDLMLFKDLKTSFVASKTYQDQEIKALEWPGLWNGAMSDWLTFFMEIPLEAFNPVKTVNDLLR